MVVLTKRPDIQADWLYGLLGGFFNWLRRGVCLLLNGRVI